MTTDGNSCNRDSSIDQDRPVDEDEPLGEAALCNKIMNKLNPSNFTN